MAADGARTGRLESAIASDRFAVTCELNPPKGTDLGALLDSAATLAGVVDGFNLTDSHAALMAMSPLAAAHLMLARGAEPVLQMTTRDRNRIALQGDLLAAHALGVRNVVFMGGDPPANGDHPDARPVFDVYSAQMLAAARGLEQGHDMSGAALRGTPRFFLGAVVNPGTHHPDRELRRLEEKIEAGARFFQTQAIYDPRAFERFARAVEPLGAVLLAGIIPLKSARMAAWMNANVPGIEVPEALVREVADAATPREAGLAMAARILAEIRPMCRGVHVMPIGAERRLPELLERAGVTPGAAVTG